MLRWLGSGSVWKKLPTAQADKAAEEEAAEEDEWIMNYRFAPVTSTCLFSKLRSFSSLCCACCSQEYDCEPAGKCQSIFFSTSKDLVNWTPVAPDAQRTNSSLVFK